MSRVHSSNLLRALLAGALVGLVSLALVLAAGVAQAAPPAQAETPAPETSAAAPAPAKACAECHPDVDAAWQASPHAHAYSNEAFTARHQAAARPGECLACHTTGYQASSGEYQAAGVACAACHGEPVAEHPPAVIPVRSDSEYCGACHTPTHSEWRLSGHAAAGVGCTDCHNPHSQAALFENPDELCLNCHKDDLATHQNDTHLAQGIGCVDCHALHLPPAEPPEDGLVPTGHGFNITAATCVACHTDTLGIGAALPGYEAGAKTMAAAGEGAASDPALPGLVSAYTGEAEQEATTAQQIQALEAALASTRLSTLFQGGIVGLVLGGTTAFFVARNGRREEDAAEDGEAAEATSAEA